MLRSLLHRKQHHAFLLVVAVVTWLDHVSGEAFSATANLIRLVEAEQQLIPNLEEYIQTEERRLDEIRKYLAEIRAKNATAESQNSLFYAGHPVNAYNLIKRWYHIANSTTTEDANPVFRRFFRSLSLPTEQDYLGACAALVRLQRTFALRTEDVAEGRVLDEMAAQPILADDCVQIGLVALQVQDYGLAAEWLEKALSTTSDSNPIRSHTKAYSSLSMAYRLMGDLRKAVSYAEKALELDPENPDLVTELEQIKQDLAMQQSSGDVTPITWSRSAPDWKLKYERLCRGEPDATSDPKYTQNLICRYKPGRLGWVTYKEEVLGWHPRVSFFYDIISDATAEMVKEKAYPSLYRGTIGDPANPAKSEIRVSKVTWLWDTDSEIELLSQKVEDITGLETDYSNPLSKSEPFQVVNYGIGGQYEPHVDYYEDKEQLGNVPDFIQNTGDRISTFLIYLTDVKHGGSTVFPRINLRVPITKNGATFWYNAKLSGEFDKNTEHAGCPVLLGQKWVTNKWIRERGQEFRRPCALSFDAIDYS